MGRKIKVDTMRGFAYIGKHGYHIMFCPDGLYIEDNGKQIFLTSKNTKILKNIY